MKSKNIKSITLLLFIVLGLHIIQSTLFNVKEGNVNMGLNKNIPLYENNVESSDYILKSKIVPCVNVNNPYITGDNDTNYINKIYENSKPPEPNTKRHNLDELIAKLKSEIFPSETNDEMENGNENDGYNTLDNRNVSQNYDDIVQTRMQNNDSNLFVNGSGVNVPRPVLSSYLTFGM